MNPKLSPLSTLILSILNQAVLLQVFSHFIFWEFLPTLYQANWSMVSCYVSRHFKKNFVMLATFQSPGVSSELNELVNVPANSLVSLSTSLASLDICLAMVFKTVYAFL